MFDNVVIPGSATLPVSPLVLAPNQIEHFYRGGPAISELRGVPCAGERRPEDWVAATVGRFGAPTVGATVLDDGRTLRDAVAADPEGYLGPAHVERVGADTELLVKLIDAGERLPVHCHPDRAFARRHLDCPHGKTEAWVIVATEAPEASVYLGFAREVDPARLRGWVANQDTAALLDVMNEVTVARGDAVFVPAGVPHAIGEGILLVELQEPTDLSVLLEWDGYAIDGPRDGHLELGFDVALQCVDRSAWGLQRLEELRTRVPVRSGSRRLLPRGADDFFRAEWLVPLPTCSLGADFSVLVVVEGRGELVDAEGNRLILRRGMTVLVPWGAGSMQLTGPIEVVRCRPPAPVAAGQGANGR